MLRRADSKGQAAKPNTNNQPAVKAAKLPSDLASRILDIQLEIEDNKIDKQKVLELLQLYSQAVEFYEQRQDPKYKVFEQRIHSFLKKSSINQILNGGPAQTDAKHRLQSQKMDAQRGAYERAKSIIQYFNKKIEKQTQTIERSISSQKEKILERVRERSSSRNKDRLNRSMMSDTSDTTPSEIKTPTTNPRNPKEIEVKEFLKDIEDVSLLAQIKRKSNTRIFI